MGAMPLTPLFTLLGSITALILGFLGVTDAALTSQVQATVAAAAGLVVAVLAYCHHTSKQNADALSVEAVQAANQAAQLALAAQQAGRHAAAPQTAPLVPLSGSAVEALNQRGTVATAPPLPPVPAGPTLQPPVVGEFAPTASTPGSADDYPTSEIAVVR